LEISLRSLIILLLEAFQKRLGLACEQLIETADARFDEPCHAISRT